MDQKKFINNGYEIFKVKKKDANLLRSIIIKYIKFKIKKKNFTDLNLLHKYYPVEKLNGLRVFLYNKINKDKKIQNIIHSSFKNIVDTVVGSENVQSYISLSIQYPGDETSLLPLHSDSSQSDSDFQANFWLPFVNVQKTKSMFIVNPKNSLKILKKIRNQKNITVKFLETKHKKEMKMMKYIYSIANENICLLYKTNLFQLKHDATHA